jgi:hypothetical protein
MLFIYFRFTRTYPTSPSTHPSETSLTSPPTHTPKYSNVFIAFYHKLLISHVLHPFLPPTTSITSSLWYPLTVHKAELNSIATIIYLDHYMRKSNHVLLNTSTFSPVSFLPKHPTLSSVSVKAIHKTAFSIGNLTQASIVNYTPLSTQLPTNPFAHGALQLTFWGPHLQMHMYLQNWISQLNS